MSTKVWRKAHKTPQYHLGPKPVWTQIKYFWSFQVLVKRESEVVQNRQFMTTIIICQSLKLSRLFFVANTTCR